MTDFVIPPVTQTTLRVKRATAVFPVGRVFCIGRNYPWGQVDTRARLSRLQFPAGIDKPAFQDDRTTLKRRPPCSPYP
ncbi:hypothetical protein [Variovorax sp. RA8]|uniref:hypothetical protein n=1 Tax=Variovorax sp. (strain JCM 16519 / RA8) TaxID=662548 RepID=UPI000AC8AA82|nr:hypothetical protein [Variovorax sp. RA8]VTU25427.1 hypothetical protein RA8CHR_03133 [Variovorax sp. RA8]